MRVLLAVMCSGFLLLGAAGQNQTEQNQVDSDSHHARDPSLIFGENPADIWNRVYDALIVRRDEAGHAYGADSLDPLLWWETKHLLGGRSHERALNVLGEFLRTHAESEIPDPVKRLWLQRELWAVFDWSASLTDRDATQRRELQTRLAEVIRRVALTSGEIKSLPDTYTRALASGMFAKEYDSEHRGRPFLPPDFFQPAGPWVELRSGYLEPVAPSHVFASSGRSQFHVLLRLPAERKATLDYLRSLWAFPEAWVPREFAPDQAVPSTRLPQFPVGTQVALVREMITFDRNGQLVPTPIIESVQMRVYHSIPARTDHNDVNVDWAAARKEQDRYEIRLNRSALFAHEENALRAVEQGESELFTFMTQGRDPFEQSDPFREFGSPILKFCVACHSAPGINSLQSRTHLLKPNTLRRDPEKPESQTPTPWWQTDEIVWWKQQRYDWGLLNGYWNAGPAANSSKPQ